MPIRIGDSGFRISLAMSVINIFSRLSLRCENSKKLLQRRIPASCTNTFQCSGMKVSADDLRDLPRKPKKPLTPYFRFMAQLRPELKKEHPDSKVTDIVKMAAIRWEKTAEDVRQKYMEEYKKDLINYATARTKYEGLLTTEQKELMKRAKYEVEVAREKRKLKKKMKELGKPKRPVSPFIAFFNSKVHERGDIPYKEWVRGLAKEWLNLPPELKASYQRESSVAMENHRRQIQEWEERMIRMGHIDVVRSEALIEPKQSKRVTKGSPTEKHQ